MIKKSFLGWAIPIMILIITITLGLLLRLPTGLNKNNTINHMVTPINENISIMHYYEKYGTNMVILGVNYTLMDKKPQIDYFIESMNQESNVLEEEMKKINKELGNNIIIYPRYTITKNLSNNSTCYDKGNYCSTKGIRELEQDIRELCAYYYIGTDEYYDFVTVTNRLCDLNNINTCWINATEIININTTQINKCYEEEKRDMMLDERRTTTGALKIINNQIFINARPYNGSINNIKEAICQEYNQSTTPETCIKLAG